MLEACWIGWTKRDASDFGEAGDVEKNAVEENAVDGQGETFFIHIRYVSRKSVNVVTSFVQHVGEVVDKQCHAVSSAERI